MEAMMMLIIPAAAVLAVLVALARLTPARRAPDHPDLPMLGEVMRLARRERGPFGLRWTLRLQRLWFSGAILNATAPMISDNWVALLTPGLRKVFRDRQHPREELFKRTQIFPLDTSQRAFEEYQGTGEMGADAWNEFEKTGRTPMDAVAPTWKTRLEHREFTKGFSVRRKLMDDNLYPGAPIPKSITQDVVQLKDSAELFREKSAADVFNNAFTDSGTDSAGYSVAGADGVGLCSTAHPRSASDATTQGNEGTLALTSDNLVATKNLMREFKDSSGELSAAHPDLLLVPPELEETAIKITSGDLDPDSANNTVNVNKGRYRIVVWDYLTDADAWFLIDSTLKAEHLVWLDRIMPEFDSERDLSTQIGEWFAYMRFSRGWAHWNWLFGQNAS